MARHSSDSPEVVNLRAHLTDLVLRYGSVNATVQALNGAVATAEITIHPHRVFGILSGDKNRQVNTATLKALEAAVEEIRPPDSYAVVPDSIKSRINAFGDLSDQVIATVAEEFDVPEGIVRVLSEGTQQQARHISPALPKNIDPDWSWQETAISNCLTALRKSIATRAALIVPTGGGKTRIALQTALRWNQTSGGRVVWVTHRKQLAKQAQRTLQRLLREQHLDDEQILIQYKRIDFVMVAKLREHLASHQDDISLYIVDEGHHIAAPSYVQILEQTVAPVLVLTATPNRRDNLPLGLTEIAFETTYQVLFEKRCLVEPIFDKVEDILDLDWLDPVGLRSLAVYLLDRSDADFSKLLVAVTRKSYAENLHAALTKELNGRASGRLTVEDIAYVHADKNSHGVSDSGDFLDEFSAKPQGILIATQSLIGEGFDDPGIDAVFITYPSESISQLMQVAGRALRQAPGKTSAHIIRVRTNALEYHFNHLWLHQDITDILRPDVEIYEYASTSDREKILTDILTRHNVPGESVTRVLRDANQSGTETIKLMLSGAPYWGAPKDFHSDATWSPLLVREDDRQSFIRIFNEVAERDRNEPITDITAYLRRSLPTGTDTRTRDAYATMLHAIKFTKDELDQIQSPVLRGRPYKPGRHTTFLKYITLKYRPLLSSHFLEFFGDAHNLNELSSAYTDDPSKWVTGLRIEAPISGSFGILLTASQSDWFTDWHDRLSDALSGVPIADRPSLLRERIAQLEACPLPQRLLENASQFFRPERIHQHLLKLTSPT
jgi:superfamily II DNA or RNA helicase